MTLTLYLPDDAARSLKLAWGDTLDRVALEALVIETYRARKISAGEAGGLLGLRSSLDALDWFTARGVSVNYGLDDLESDRKVLEQDRRRNAS